MAPKKQYRDSVLWLPIFGMMVPKNAQFQIGATMFVSPEEDRPDKAAITQSQVREFFNELRREKELQEKDAQTIPNPVTALQEIMLNLLDDHGCVAIWVGNCAGKNMKPGLDAVRNSINALKCFWRPPRPRAPFSVPTSVGAFSGYGVLVTGLRPDRVPSSLYTEPLSRGQDWLLTVGPNAVNAWLRDGLSDIGSLLRAVDSGAAEWTDKAVSLALGWYGQAWEEPYTSAVIKLRVALDAVLGFIGDKDVPSDAITARISERTAFLIGNDLYARKAIRKEAVKLFALSSKVIHGESPNVTAEQITKFEALVRDVIVEVARAHSGKKRPAFQDWFENKKFS